MVGPQHTYYNCLKVVAKRVAEHLYQNQAIDIAILKDQEWYRVDAWEVKNFLKSSQKQC